MATGSASAARPANEPIVLNVIERRVALDGEAYTFEEFASHYGWANGSAFWQTSECWDSAAQPAGVTASHPQDSAARPVTPPPVAVPKAPECKAPPNTPPKAAQFKAPPTTAQIQAPPTIVEPSRPPKAPPAARSPFPVTQARNTIL